MRGTEKEAETQAGGEAGSCGEPDVGLHPRTLRSQPEPKADVQPLSHPGNPKWSFFTLSFLPPLLDGTLL